MPFGRRGGRGSRRWAGGRHGSRWLAGIRRSAPDPGLPVPALLVPGVRVPLGVDLDSGDRVDTGNSPSPGHHPSGRCGNPLNSTIRAVTRDAETCSRCPARASPLTRTGRGGHRATGGQRPARPHPARVPPFERSWTTVPCSSIDSGWRIGDRPHQGLPTAGSPGGSRPGTPRRGRGLRSQRSAAGRRAAGSVLEGPPGEPLLAARLDGSGSQWCRCGLTALAARPGALIHCTSPSSGPPRRSRRPRRSWHDADRDGRPPSWRRASRHRSALGPSRQACRGVRPVPATRSYRQRRRRPAPPNPEGAPDGRRAVETRRHRLGPRA